MLQVTAVVAIAVGCIAMFLIASSVGIIVWMRARHRRLRKSLRLSIQRGLNVRGDTITELSREEGSALRQHGQLPYGRPTEWGLIASRESLPNTLSRISESWSVRDRMRSLRRTIPKSLSERITHTSQKAIRFPPGSKSSRAKGKEPDRNGSTKEEIPLSAIEGIMELPADITPRHTPEQDYSYLGFRPASTSWPRPSHGDTFNLLPVSEGVPSTFHPARTRLRGGSITAQSAGAMPDRPVPPPPPAAWRPNRYLMSNNDSAMHLSSISLATADSSILDDGVRRSTSIHGDFTSPPLPPCPTFIPFSAYDVGLNDPKRKPSDSSKMPFSPASYSFRQSIESIKENRDPASPPRRSMTTRHSSPGREVLDSGPRRSGTVAATSTRRDSPLRLRTHGDALFSDQELTSLCGNLTSLDTAATLQSSQVQRYATHGTQIAPGDPFFTGPPTARGPTASPVGGYATRSPQALAALGHTRPRVADSPTKPTLPSAMKSQRGGRKGHRRQNCVRISNHPPITYGRTVISPMTEEEPDQLYINTSATSNSSASDPSSAVSSMSSISPQRRGSVLETVSPVRSEGPPVKFVGSFDASAPVSPRTPSRKRKHARTDSDEESINGGLARNTTLTELHSALSTPREGGARTPSPEKVNGGDPKPAAAGSSNPTSPSAREISKLNGLRSRRSVIKGPRSQPARPASRNSVRGPSRTQGDKTRTTKPRTPPRRGGDGPLSSNPAVIDSSRDADDETPRGQTNSEPSRSRLRLDGMDETAFPGEYLAPPSNKHYNYSLTTSRCQETSCGQPNSTTSASRATTNSSSVLVGGGSKSPSPFTLGGMMDGGTSTSTSLVQTCIAELQGDDFSLQVPFSVQDGRASASKSTSTSGEATSSNHPHHHYLSATTMTTPKGNRVGLGIGEAATPSSLYDRDGFLRE